MLVALLGLPLVNPVYRFVEKVLVPVPPAEEAGLTAAKENFLDMLNALRRIRGHLTSIGYPFSETGVEAK